MDIATLENSIFDRYRDHCDMCPSGEALPDGCPDSMRYLESNFRALFVLKEAHGWKEKTDYPRDLRYFLNHDGGCYKTWGNLARWCALANDPKFGIDDLNARDPRERSENLGRGCFINLKKIPGKTRSNYKEIEEFAKSHADLLKAQFGLYKPHITISCGTFSIIRDLYGAAEQSAPQIDNVFKFFKSADLGTVVEFYHPQYLRISSSTYLEMLRSTLAYHFPRRFVANS